LTYFNSKTKEVTLLA